MQGNSIYAERIEGLRARMTQKELDAVWILQPENRRYLSGFKATDPQLTESAGSLFISERQQVLLTDSRYATEAEKEAAHFELHLVKGELASALAALILETGVKRVGFEEEHVTWRLYTDVAAELDKGATELIPMEGLVAAMREIKDSHEIEALKASARMISTIMGEIIGWLDQGRVERDVAWRIQTLARQMGAEDVAFPPIVASGPNSALPHAVASDRKIGPGEPVVLDMGVKLDGYCSDITRTVFVSEPPPQFKEIYKVVRQAQLKAMEIMRHGVMSNEADGAARGVIKDAGYGEYFGHALGHGVGLATHEAPRVGPLKPVELQAGMVVTVEPGIYIPGKGGVRLEETVLIKEDGVELLTTDANFYQF